MTPAHTARPWSSTSSDGPPVRTLADASSRGTATTVVSSSSRGEAGRASADRPGTRWSVRTRSASALATGSATSTAAPSTTTDR
jgi:hypothetical protein